MSLSEKEWEELDRETAKIKQELLDEFPFVYKCVNCNKEHRFKFEHKEAVNKLVCNNKCKLKYIDKHSTFSKG